jgi:thiol-disulfide isomerase/thioredoxin
MNSFRQILSGLRNGLLPALFVTLLLALAPQIKVQDIPELPAPDGSSYTPEITVTLLDNKELKLSSLRGKVVMLDFFWTKCPHCQHHAPHVAKLYNKYRNRGFVIVGLATDEPSRSADVKAFMKEFGISYPVGYISTEVIAYYGDQSNRGVPQMVVFGPDGKMTLRRISWSDEIGKEIEEEVAKQLDKLGPAPAAPGATTKPGATKTSGKVSAKPKARRTA